MRCPLNVIQKKINLQKHWRNVCFLPVGTVFLLSGCATKPPSNPSDVCSVFKQKSGWKQSALASQRRWGVPISVQMAILHQESRFRHNALPARTKLLWVLPGPRPSSAYGYTQALDTTWALYKRDEGGWLARRDNFDDAVDFVGWYANNAYRRAGIAKNNAYDLYLAYHEGVTGYQQRTYLKKQWLMHVAKKVQNQARIYKTQLKRCNIHDYP